MPGRKLKQKYSLGDTELYCPRCEQSKPLDDYQISNSRKTGRQLYCRVCQNQKTLEYRVKTEGAWWRHKEGDPYYIYYITNPVGEIYVGYTSTKPNLRWARHRAQHRFGFTQLKKINESFILHGIDNHTFHVVEFATTKNEAKLKETYHVLKLRAVGKSLNTHVSCFRVAQKNRKTGELIKEWESIGDAADMLGKAGYTIYATLKNSNRRGTAYGYLWEVLPFEDGSLYDPKQGKFV